jgi:hypothetical protein
MFLASIHMPVLNVDDDEVLNFLAVLRSFERSRKTYILRVCGDKNLIRFGLRIVCSGGAGVDIFRLAFSVSSSKKGPEVGVFDSPPALG